MSSQNSGRLIVVGAADPESMEIVKLLVAAGEQVVFATVAGVRVHPGNAYKANGVAVLMEDGRLAESGLLFTARQNGDEVVLVECGGTGDFEGPVTVIDHHRPGDPGYGRGPEDFLGASSIGQVIALLARAGKIPETHWARKPLGSLSVTDDRTKLIVGLGEGRGFLPGRLALVAAADHCLEAAYRGKCPGVEPDELVRWRAETRAAFQKRSVGDVLADVEAARKVLVWAMGVCSHCHQWGGNSSCEFCAANGPLPDFADLRGQTVAELPEAVAREGIPYVATVSEKDGRKKVVLGAASPQLVTRFLARELVPGLTGFYGDPARGFAGGYLV